MFLSQMPRKEDKKRTVGLCTFETHEISFEIETDKRRFFIAKIIGLGTVSSLGMLGLLTNTKGTGTVTGKPGALGLGEVSNLQLPTSKSLHAGADQEECLSRIEYDGWLLFVNPQFLPDQLPTLVEQIRINPGRFEFNFAQVLGQNNQAKKMQQFTQEHGLKLARIEFNDWSHAHKALSKGVVDMVLAPLEVTDIFT